MDWTWSSFFWLFPLLCLAFMLAMMVMMLARGGSCCGMGHGGHRNPAGQDGNKTTEA